MSKNIELLDGGVGKFSNILPATFVDSLTYIEQLKVIAEVLNKTVEVVNEIIESGGSGYILPPATNEKLGGIKVGENLTITEDGVLNAEAGGGVLSANVEQTENGAVISITDKDGTTTATISNGSPGPQGPAGADGAAGAPGPQGPAGQNGTDGFSPTASVQQTETGATITITDKNGTTTANVKNGKDGSGGSYVLPAATSDTLGGVKVPLQAGWAPEGFEKQNAIQNQNGVIIVQVGKGITLNAEDAVGYLSIKLGTGLYFDEQGRLCASGGVVTTGIADEVATTETQSEGSGITETVRVNDSVNFTKF